MDTTKYDRQIRLFGMETQQKILHQTIQVLGSPSSICSEIIKNIVLLGTGKIIINEGALDKTKELVPDDLSMINDKLEIAIRNTPGECDFMFLVDYKEIEPVDDRSEEKSTALNNSSDISQSLCRKKTPFYFICSKCLVVMKNKVDHICTCLDNQNTKDGAGMISGEVKSFAINCIVGAFAVQEYLKYIVDPESSVDTYRFNL